TLDPQDRQTAVKAAALDRRQAVDLDHAVRVAQLFQRIQLERPRDVLGVVALHRLHDARGNGRLKVQALALGNGDRARVGTTHHDHGNVDAVEPGDIGDPGRADDR